MKKFYLFILSLTMFSLGIAGILSAQNGDDSALSVEEVEKSSTTTTTQSDKKLDDEGDPDKTFFDEAPDEITVKDGSNDITISFLSLGLKLGTGIRAGFKGHLLSNFDIEIGVGMSFWYGGNLAVSFQAQFPFRDPFGNLEELYFHFGVGGDLYVFPKVVINPYGVFGAEYFFEKLINTKVSAFIEINLGPSYLFDASANTIQFTGNIYLGGRYYF